MYKYRLRSSTRSNDQPIKRVKSESKQDQLRRALLGDKLYSKCSSNRGVSNFEIEARIQELNSKYDVLKNCSLDDFANLCALKDSPSSVRILPCLEDGVTNQIYYDQHKQNYFYDII